MTRQYVYKLCDPRDQTIRYIGITEEPNYRLYGHSSDKTSAAYDWIRFIREEGLKVTLEVVAEFENRDHALDYEAYLISKTPGLLNRSCPYGRHPDPKPTATPRWPYLRMDELEYVREDYDEPPEWKIAMSVHRMLPHYPAAHIYEIIKAMAVITSEDHEHAGVTDE